MSAEGDLWRSPGERVLAAQLVIDTIDNEIILLVERRRLHSQAVECARRAALRPRTDLVRENCVLGTYYAHLGPVGTALAMALLKDCNYHT